MSFSARAFGILCLAGASACLATTPTPIPMSYETCAASTVCTVRGVATVRPAEHAPTVELDLGNGRCINVSLPPRRMDELRQAGPSEITVTGTVYWEPTGTAGEESVLEINGRRIGYGICGRFFLFVRDEQGASGYATTGPGGAPKSSASARQGTYNQVTGRHSGSERRGPR